MHWAPSCLPSHSILSSPFRGHAFHPAKRFGGFVCIGTFSVFLAITIDQLRPNFHCVKQLYTPQLSVLLTVHTISILVTIRISIADLIGGARGVSNGKPLRLGTFGCEKNVLIITVKNMLQFENVWKCTTEMYLFRFLNTPQGGGRQHRRLPRSANTLAPPLGHFIHFLWWARHTLNV